MSRRTSRYLGSYGQCDSFWVEGDDGLDGLFAARAAAREQKRRDDRQRELAFAEQLSKLTAEEYTDDVLSHMLEMEVTGQISFLKYIGLTRRTEWNNARCQFH
jgi:hypothetical protein